ncbi:hypothetical protein LOK49_Contig233G00006 [Camellia lanceoleosa]|nr:hypothetical protein LOK49_Contig233G00006 [Camellia lanceoleosa]
MFVPEKAFDTRYQKLQEGELGEEKVARSLTTNPAAKYVIIEVMDDQDDGPWELGNHTVESDKETSDHTDKM